MGGFHDSKEYGLTQGKIIPGYCSEVAVTLCIGDVLSYKVYLIFLTEALSMPVLQEAGLAAADRVSWRSKNFWPHSRYREAELMVFFN